MTAESPTALTAAAEPLTGFFIESEQAFYARYGWCLNPYLPVHEVMMRLRAEVAHFAATTELWQRDEVMNNIVLLACAISDAADDCLNPKRHDFVSKLPRVLKPAAWGPQLWANVQQRRLQAQLAGLRPWREQWEASCHALLGHFVAADTGEPAAFLSAAQQLLNRLDAPLPPQFTERLINSPRAFRSQDFALRDVYTLADKFCATHTNPEQPCLVVGMRTAGSYFGPVLRACLVQRGYRHTGIITVRPKGGLHPEDFARIQAWAERGAVAVVIDETVHQGGTIASCIRLLRQAGFAAPAIYALVPVHPSGRDWQHNDAVVAFSRSQIVSIEPEETFKHACLEPERMTAMLQPYFAARGFSRVQVTEDAATEQFHRELVASSDKWFHTRLKRVYAVQLTTPSGALQTRYVIAKSVGWGWIGYQAYFTAQRLLRFVPPVLGYRHGILVSEWLPGAAAAANGAGPVQVERLAEYVAARVTGLPLNPDPSPALCRAQLQLGMDMLTGLLYSAYGSGRITRPKQHWIRDELAALSSPMACLIDGKMSAREWLLLPGGMRKTDYEQHGMGRMDFSFTDPAYDLAEAILSFELSAQDEARLLQRYAALAGDADVGTRLPLYKLVAAHAAMDWSYKFLGHPGLTDRHAELNRQYITAWTFAMVQMARLSASMMPQLPVEPTGPMVFCDVDGVIDRHLFKFPTTTPAGMQALSLLLGHGYAVYLNTARSSHDVAEYCAAYGLAGGVAETGSYLWDALAGKGRVLISAAAQAEIERLREALAQLPGVFTNPYYRYSIKAYLYRGGGTVPVPNAIINKVIAATGVSLLAVHHTHSDTVITARDVDKGTGLRAMAEWLGRAAEPTIAIGDTGPDLAMFRVADRGYAPGHSPVAVLAKLLDAHVAAEPFQPGFLKIAQRIVHPDGATCARCAVQPQAHLSQQQLLLTILAHADKGRRDRLMSAATDFRSWAAFLRKTFAQTSR